MIPKLITNYWAWFINLVMSLIGVGLLAYIVWDSDYFDELHVQITMSAGLALLPLIVLLDIRKAEPEFREFNWYAFGLLVVAALLFTIVIGSKFGSTSMVLNGASLFSSVLPFVIYVTTVKKNRFLIVAVIPTVSAGLVYLYLLVRSDISTEYLPVLVPFVLTIGIPWIIALRLFWEYAKRVQQHRLIGPLMESLTMLLVATPLVALAMLSVNAITGGDTWVAVAGITTSFVFSSAVATPFARFLRALADLGNEHKHTEQADSSHSNH